MIFWGQMNDHCFCQKVKARFPKSCTEVSSAKKKKKVDILMGRRRRIKKKRKAKWKIKSKFHRFTYTLFHYSHSLIHVFSLFLSFLPSPYSSFSPSMSSLKKQYSAMVKMTNLGAQSLFPNPSTSLVSF